MLNPYNTNLPPDLRALKEEIEGYARGYGLDFFETIFEVIDADDLNEIAAYGGFRRATLTGRSACPMRSCAKAMTMGCPRFMKWSSIMIRVMHISCAAIIR